MKTEWKVILVSLVVAIMFFAAQSPCRSAEKDDVNSVWVEDGPDTPNMPLEPTCEKSEQLGKKVREHAERRSPREPQMRQEKGMPGVLMGPQMMGQGKGMWMQEKEADHLKWLEKNYPDDAAKLTELKKKNPELYLKQMMHSMRTYGRIEEAEKENPQLAEVLKSDLQLRREQDKLLGKIKDAATENEKKQLSDELEKTISNRFDFIVKRKQIEYEMLLKRLEKLKEDVKKSEATVEKWKDQKFKNDAVKSRIEELLSRSEKFQWD
jgi:hypothetical protein